MDASCVHENVWTQVCGDSWTTISILTLRHFLFKEYIHIMIILKLSLLQKSTKLEHIL